MNRLAKLLPAALAALIPAATLAADPEWMNQVGQALGKPGNAMPGGVYRVGLARSDLKVTLDGVEIKPALALASTLHDALGERKTPLGGAAPAGAPGEVKIDLDTSAIDAALGHKGKAMAGVYQMNIPRAEKVRDAGMEVPEAMGSAIGINFQPTGGGKAAITGDFVLTAKEVNPVLKALRDNGIEVTALHNHMLADEPRLFFMHFWANDDASKLLQGLKTALSHVNVAHK